MDSAPFRTLQKPQPSHELRVAYQARQKISYHAVRGHIAVMQRSGRFRGNSGSRWSMPEALKMIHSGQMKVLPTLCEKGYAEGGSPRLPVSTAAAGSCA